MKTAFSRRPLIIPVENQIRELESKLLLASVAAERGFPVIIGSRADVHLKIASLPRGVYIAKSMAPSSVRIFDIMRKLGHEIVSWVDDALIHYPPPEYFEMRLSARAMRQVSTLFAWGQENAELFAQSPDYHGVPIHITGNPRIDMLRPELRPYFDEEVRTIRSRYGNFILINTNFGKLNHYVPERSSWKWARSEAMTPKTADFLAALADHRDALFSHFRDFVPSLARAFPDDTIVVRPHPVENLEPWRTVAAQHANVYVVLEGNVIPWLMASKVLIHNACTTGIEAFMLGVPAINYRPVTSDRFDVNLPSALSYPALDFDELREKLRIILRGELGPCNDPKQWQHLERHVASLDGRLASDRIVDVLERAEYARRGRPAPRPREFWSGLLHASLRAGAKALNSRIPGKRMHAEFQNHRFPGLGRDEVRARIQRFHRRLGRFDDLKLKQLSEKIFEITH